MEMTMLGSIIDEGRVDLADVTRAPVGEQGRDVCGHCVEIPEDLEELIVGLHRDRALIATTRSASA